MGETNVLSTPSFLHSPWQEELLALQSRVSQQTANREAKDRARAMKRKSCPEQKPGSIGSPLISPRVSVLHLLSCKTCQVFCIHHHPTLQDLVSWDFKPRWVFKPGCGADSHSLCPSLTTTGQANCQCMQHLGWIW